MEQEPVQHSAIIIFLQRRAANVMPFFFMFQVFRIVSLVFFAIFVVDCTLWDEKTSVDCNNFTLYVIPACGPYCWKTIWLCSSNITSLVMLVSLCNRFVPEMRLYKNSKVFKVLLKKQYFWSLTCTLVLVIIYDVLIMINNHEAKIYIEILVVMSKIFTLVLVFQLNFTLPPTVAAGFKVITVVCYYFSMALFGLDNLCKVVTTSAQVAFKVYTVDRRYAPQPITIVDLMLMVVNAALYNSFLQFFWHKIFCGKKDILKVYRGDLFDNIEMTVPYENPSPR